MRFSKFKALFRRRKLVQRADEELQFHLRMQMEENIRRGLDPQDARRKLGNLTQASEEVFRMNTIKFLDEAVQNVRFSLRTMRRNPGFALTAVLVLDWAPPPRCSGHWTGFCSARCRMATRTGW
jgi:hypothetical protein